MTDDTHSDTESNPHTNTNGSESSYPPDDGHLCDQAINYDEVTITLPLAEKDDGCRELSGTCKECGRDITITASVDIDMLKVTDVDSGETLHEY